MKTSTKVGLASGLGIATILGVVLISRQAVTWPVGHPPPYDPCTERVFYIRNCEASPYSVAAGIPGYAGQICGNHAVAFRGEDLFTYALWGQDGNPIYRRPPDSAGSAVQAAWDACVKDHKTTWPGGPFCVSAVAPSGTQNYSPITLAQLKVASPAQYPAYFNLFGCAARTPSPGVSATAVPSATPTGGLPAPPTVTPVLVCPTNTPKVCPTQRPCPVCPPTATPHIGPAPTRPPGA